MVGLSDKVLKPAFSPDGNQVAFYILGSENAGIYTTMVGSEKSLRLTSSSGDCCPRWSPDGRQVAFFRTSDDGVAAVYVIPAFGGTEHRLYSGPAGFSHRAVDWSPDGKTLAFTERHEDRTHNWIALLSLADSSVRRLTSPSALEFDYGPAFSPDGSTVAFIRGTLGGAPADLYVMSSAGGAPRRLTYDNTWIYPPPTWTPDGRDIVFSSARGGFINLWRISSSGGTPWPVAGGGYGAVSPSISPKGNQLVYSQKQPDLRNIWRLDLRDRKHRQGPPRQVIGEKGWKGRPYFSPEGKRIAFESWQSGYLEIRACDSDGSNCGQLTSLRGTAGSTLVAGWSLCCLRVSPQRTQRNISSQARWFHAAAVADLARSRQPRPQLVARWKMDLLLLRPRWWAISNMEGTTQWRTSCQGNKKWRRVCGRICRRTHSLLLEVQCAGHMEDATRGRGRVPRFGPTLQGAHNPVRCRMVGLVGLGSCSGRNLFPQFCDQALRDLRILRICHPEDLSHLDPSEAARIRIVNICR